MRRDLPEKAQSIGLVAALTALSGPGQGAVGCIGRTAEVRDVPRGRGSRNVASPIFSFASYLLRFL
jgi:hypothetical protein